MRLKDHLRKLAQDYFTIFAVIVITLTILRQVFAPDTHFELKDIFIYMICALVADLPSLILYTPKEISEKEMRLRIILHFVVLEAALLVLGNVTGWVKGASSTVIFAIQIAVIYVVIRFLKWKGDSQSAQSINQRLQAMRDESAGITVE